MQIVITTYSTDMIIEESAGCEYYFKEWREALNFIETVLSHGFNTKILVEIIDRKSAEV
jgi:hypothetical protein